MSDSNPPDDDKSKSKSNLIKTEIIFLRGDAEVSSP